MDFMRIRCVGHCVGYGVGGCVGFRVGFWVGEIRVHIFHSHVLSAGSKHSGCTSPRQQFMNPINPRLPSKTVAPLEVGCAPAVDKGAQLTNSHTHLMDVSLDTFCAMQSKSTTDIEMTTIRTAMTVLLAAIFTHLASYVCQLVR